MKGHDKIIEARRRRQKPAVINFIDYKIKWDLEFGDVWVVDEPLHLLDLRFIVGCLVTISSDNQERCDQLEQLCKQHGAKQIAAGLVRKYY